jgi:opacity protein-like surface antigen
MHASKTSRIARLATACSALALATGAHAADDVHAADGTTDTPEPRDPSNDRASRSENGSGGSGRAANFWEHDGTRTGFQAGVRVAYTDGVGVVYKGVHLSDASSGALPLLVDVGWRIAPELYVGVYGQYAPVFLKTYALTCPSGSSCTAQDWRFGVEADYHFLPRSTLDPYVGLGVGYEILHTSLRGVTLVQQGGTFMVATVQESFTDRGWEFVSLTAGLDWRFCESLGAGLFVLGTLGEYNVQAASGTATTSTQQDTLSFAPIPIAPHALAFVGLRGSFNL